MSLPQLFSAHLEKSLVQFTEHIAQGSTWSFLKQLKSLQKGQLSEDVFLKTQEAGQNVKGQLPLLQRWRESFRFFMGKLRHRFQEVPEADLAAAAKGKASNAKPKPDVVDETSAADARKAVADDVRPPAGLLPDTFNTDLKDMLGVLAKDEKLPQQLSAQAERQLKDVQTVLEGGTVNEDTQQLFLRQWLREDNPIIQAQLNAFLEKQGIRRVPVQLLDAYPEELPESLITNRMTTHIRSMDGHVSYIAKDQPAEILLTREGKELERIKPQVDVYQYKPAGTAEHPIELAEVQSEKLGHLFQTVSRADGVDMSQYQDELAEALSSGSTKALREELKPAYETLRTFLKYAGEHSEALKAEYTRVNPGNGGPVLYSNTGSAEFIACQKG